MRIQLNDFRGTAPRIDDEQLADGLSVVALNVEVGETLKGWLAPLNSGDTLPADTTTMFRYLDAFWFSFNTDVECVEAPVVNDPWDYVVITDGSYPKITRSDIATGGAVHPNVTHRLGLPIPDSPTAVTRANALYTGPADSSDPNWNVDVYDFFTTAYKITYVDQWGRETAGSTATSSVDIREYEGEMQIEVELTLPAVPVGYPLLGTGAKIRIYRINNASNGTGVFQYIDEIPITDASYIDRKVSSELLEALETDTWVGPPDDNITLFPNGPMRNVCVVSEAILCGHNKHTLCFSEPNQTHAWPVEYYQIFNETIVKTVPYGSSIVVLTDDHPYIVDGVHPSSMSRLRLANPAPCVTDRGVVSAAGAIFYVGARGLHMISGSQVANVSEAFYDTLQWQALQPSNMRLSRHRDSVFIHLFDGRTLIFDPTNPNGGVLEVGITVKATYTDPETETLYFLGQDNSVYEFEGNVTRLTVRYETKHFRFHDPVNFIAGRVRANKFPCDIRIKMRRLDGNVVQYDKTVNNDRFFYIPSRSQMIEWWVEIDNKDVEIRSINLATSIGELNGDI